MSVQKFGIYQYQYQDNQGVSQGAIGPVKLHWPKHPFSYLWRFEPSLTGLWRSKHLPLFCWTFFLSCPASFPHSAVSHALPSSFPPPAWSAQLRTGAAQHLLLPSNCIQELFGEKFVGLHQEPIPVKAEEKKKNWASRVAGPNWSPWFFPNSLSSCRWFPSWILQPLLSPPHCEPSQCNFTSLFFLQVSSLGLSTQQFSQWPEPRLSTRAGLCVLVFVSLSLCSSTGRKFWQNSPSESQFYFSKRPSRKHHKERWTGAILLEMSEYKSKLLPLNSPRKYTLTVKANEWESQMRC